MTENFNTLLAHATGGRRYCFVLMSYHEEYTFFEKLRRIVSEVTGFECIRADDLHGSGSDLREKIHHAIRSSAFVICDVSQPRPNIYYEYGYSAACGKPVILIAKEKSKIHTDLQGLEIIRYKDNREGWQNFEPALKRHLEVQKDNYISLLRAMILPSEPQPSLIIINPKQLQTESRFKHHPKEIITYGDYLGLSGIMVAFASVYGEHVVPEIINAAYAKEDLVNRDANLFLIGSPKVNKFIERMLSEIQKGKIPNWRFEKCPGAENDTDYEMSLLGEPPSGSFRTKCIGTHAKIKSGKFVDYGLIIRASHPFVKGRSMVILAGPHSVGTGSACLAATKTILIQEIKQKLEKVTDISDKNKTIWVITKGVTNRTGHLDVSGVTIEEAGVIY